jgi:tetratricopeptide (TPR) repeat protein
VICVAVRPFPPCYRLYVRKRGGSREACCRPRRSPASLTLVPVPAQQPAPQPPPASNPASQKPALTVQHEANFDAERAQANQLYLAGKRLEGLPLYEDLCRQDQANPAFAERHGQGLLAKMGASSDQNERNALMGEALKELQRAESLGDNSPALEILLGTMTRTPVGMEMAGPMGGLPLTVGYIYGGTPEAQQFMRASEPAFGRGDFAGALKAYLAAAAADPKWYMAALFTGDTYYRLKDYANAGIWFAKAIAIDPDRETAYRYWGDALQQSGDSAGARVKFEQAVAAEPYDRIAFNGLRQWCLINHISLVSPKVTRLTFLDANGKPIDDATLATDAGDGRSSWAVYRQQRLAHGKNVPINQLVMSGSVTTGPTFTFFPTGYVHTLAEEVEAITAMLADVRQRLASGAVTLEKLDPGLKTLLQIQKDNMLEPFILLNFSDAGIRHGYPEYRAAHRDQVVAYIDRYLIGPPTPANATSPYVYIQP